MKSLKKVLNKRVREIWKSPNWFKSSFSPQINFIKDPAKLKVAQCTRRAGKSYGCGIYLFKEAFETPGVTVLYIATTKSHAKKIMWKDVLKPIDRMFNINSKFNEYDLTITLPNGSIIYLEGADASHDAAERLRGLKTKLIILDEAGSFVNDVEAMINKILLPTLIDYDGALAMIGTTNDFIHSYFARCTRKEVRGISVHKWISVDNPYTSKQVKAKIQNMEEADPNIRSKPWFRQEYLNEWVVDTKNLVYKYTSKNLIYEVPKGDYVYSLGVTLSYSGHSAFVIVGYSSKSRNAYILDTVSYNDSNLMRAIEMITRLHTTFEFSHIVCAETSNRLVEELRKRFAVPVKEAPVKDKPALIRLFTTELEGGFVKVPEDKKDLLNEWDSIILDTRVSTDVREHPACKNQLATAALYAWQYCFNYTYKEVILSEDPIDEYWDEISEQMQNPIEDPFNDFYP